MLQSIVNVMWFQLHCDLPIVVAGINAQEDFGGSRLPDFVACLVDLIQGQLQLLHGL